MFSSFPMIMCESQVACVRQIAVLLIVLSTAACAIASETTGSQKLRLPIRHLFADNELKFHEPAQLTSASRVTVTRLEYLVTDVQVQRTNGDWVEVPSSYFHLNPQEKASELLFDDITSGSCKSLSFAIGVPAALNHQDPARWPAGHPLNVLECNLHWSWAQGYIFFAMEGNAQPAGAVKKTFLYHLGNDPLLMKVQLPIPSGASLRDCELVFHVDKTWSAAERVDPQEGGGLTHSAATDTLAPRLARNIEHSWELRPRAK